MTVNTELNLLVENYAGLEGPDLIAAILHDHKGRVALLSSFGAESAVLLHMVARIDPATPVLFLNTGKLFPETTAYRAEIAARLGLTAIRDVSPPSDLLQAQDPAGDLHARDKDACCHARKTVPMQHAFADFDIIISGRKRFHGAARSDLQFITIQDRKIKVEPLAAYSAFDLKNYADLHNLPPHPLLAHGFRSIGCQPCTVAGGTDDDPRAGRWAGSEKTECGIHIAANGRIVRTLINGHESFDPSI
jgi:phosphoadenosine phosphosulfate reductase